MIISRGRRYIFVHIPKTGGTSLALALEARAMKDDILIGDTPKARRRRHRLTALRTRGRLWKHSTLADIDGLVSHSELEQFFCFTLVRNPWDRAVSYYHWLKEQRFAHSAVQLARDLDFNAFVLHPQTRAAFAAHPATRYMTDARGCDRADAYVRLEHLAEDLAPVEAYLGFDLDIRHHNRSDRDRDWRGYYSDAASQAVAEACAADIAQFGYRFGP